MAPLGLFYLINKKSDPPITGYLFIVLAYQRYELKPNSERGKSKPQSRLV